uniref:Uncharacterized protein n=1 Tax=Oryza punctata TaxID=4537 RepID=A0A0E0MKR2_ORYPU
MDSMSSPSSPPASDHRAREDTHDRSARSTVTTVDEDSPHVLHGKNTIKAENIDEYSSDDFEDDPTIKVNVQPFAYPPEIKEMKQGDTTTADLMGDIILVNAEFKCLMAEYDLLDRIFYKDDAEILVKIGTTVVIKKEMNCLTRNYGYDAYEKCLDEKIVEARINDMRSKVPYDERMCSVVYLENTSIAKMFLFFEENNLQETDSEKFFIRLGARSYLGYNMVGGFGKYMKRLTYEDMKSTTAIKIGQKTM